MTTPTRHEVEMFMSITGASEQQAVRKLEEYGGNLSLAVDAHFSEGIEENQRGNASSAVYPDNISRESYTPVQQRGILPFLSAVRRFQPSFLLDPVYRRNLLNQIGGSALTNNLPVAPNASHAVGTPLPFNGGSQQGLRPPLYAHSEAETYSPNSYGTSAEEQMVQAAIEASMHEAPSGHGLLHQDSDREDDELNHAIALSLVISEQEKAKHELQMKNKDQEWESCASGGGRTGNMIVKGSSSNADGASNSEGQAAERSSKNNYSEQHGFHASESQESQRTSPGKKAVLPEEPPLDSDDTINLVVRMPDGSRHGRRFLKSNKLQSLFDFIDLGGWVEPGTYRLVIPYPRQALEIASGSQSLSELGLNSKQEALYLELV